MKIERVETFHIRYPLTHARGASVRVVPIREWLFVKVTADDGVVGWGETEDIGVRGVIDDVLGPLLVGRNPLEHRTIWRDLWAASRQNGYAVGGLDIALHDLRGKALNLPVHQLYGGAVREKVPTYAALPGYYLDRDPADHWIEEALELVDRGFRGIKVRMGRYPPDHELSLIARIRETLGDNVSLMVDGNGAYTLPQAVRVGQALAELGLDWFEGPMPESTSILAYPLLRQKLDIALASGETLQTRQSFFDFLGRGSVDVVQPDVSICGGLSELLFVADLARLTSVQCIPHTMGGPTQLAATLHALAVLPDPSRLQGSQSPRLEIPMREGGDPQRWEVFGSVLSGGGDFVDVPTEPGLGVEVDEDAVRRFAGDGARAGY